MKSKCLIILIIVLSLQSTAFDKVIPTEPVIDEYTDLIEPDDNAVYPHPFWVIADDNLYYYNISRFNTTDDSNHKLFLGSGFFDNPSPECLDYDFLDYYYCFQYEVIVILDVVFADFYLELQVIDIDGNTKFSLIYVSIQQYTFVSTVISTQDLGLHAPAGFASYNGCTFFICMTFIPLIMRRYRV
ncbi:MAG: hypothetical protein INQ03_16490 [Candidatus Heimdallarchaeota archaeon]|nr:hypothetical protein [Candidatus Heimdallarchaeota archaeon]